MDQSITHGSQKEMLWTQLHLMSMRECTVPLQALFMLQHHYASAPLANQSLRSASKSTAPLSSQGMGMYYDVGLALLLPLSLDSVPYVIRAMTLSV